MATDFALLSDGRGGGRNGSTDTGNNNHSNDKYGGEMGFRKISLAQMGLAKSAKKVINNYCIPQKKMSINFNIM